MKGQLCPILSFMTQILSKLVLKSVFSFRICYFIRSIFSGLHSVWIDVCSFTIYRSSHWRCSSKNVFLKFSEYSQESTCVGDSFLMKLQAPVYNLLRKNFWRKCSPKNFEKFLRTTFLQNTARWLLLCLASFTENLQVSIILKGNAIVFVLKKQV